MNTRVNKRIAYSEVIQKVVKGRKQTRNRIENKGTKAKKVTVVIICILCT